MPALEEYIEWGGDEEPWQGFEAPEELVNKTAYNNWQIEELRAGSVSDSSALSQIANAIKAGNPVLGVFEYWNPEATGDRIGEVRFYEMGDEVEASEDATIGNSVGVPQEVWNPGASNTDAGHGVTGIGYIPDYDVTPDDDDVDTEDYLIIHDGWTATFTLLAVPFDEWARFYIITPAAPGPPTSSPTVSIVSSVLSGDLVTVSWSAIGKTDVL